LPLGSVVLCDITPSDAPVATPTFTARVLHAFQHPGAPPHNRFERSTGDDQPQPVDRRRAGRLPARTRGRCPRLPQRVGRACVDAAAFAPGAPREDYFETLADATRREAMDDEARAEFFLRHDTYWI
jgi:hypothetical protein